ncbi:MAG: hypothetical protein K9G48_12715 [Reyranella sp.]|nr:hypothetical protein [Reyranella sp.]
MTERPTPRLVDMLRDRESDLAPLVLKITDAAMDEEMTPADVQSAALASAAFLIVHLSPPGRMRRRAKEAELILRRFVFAHQRRVDELGIDLKAQQREMSADLIAAFGKSFREVVASMPIPEAWVKASGGADAEHYRKCLLTSELQEGLVDLFAQAWGEHSPNRVTACLATVAAAAVVVGAPLDTNDPDEEGYVDIMVDEFKSTLLKTIAYWRRQKGN